VDRSFRSGPSDRIVTKKLFDESNWAEFLAVRNSTLGSAGNQMSFANAQRRGSNRADFFGVWCKFAGASIRPFNDVKRTGPISCNSAREALA
jgi:hypothetical protein